MNVPWAGTLNYDILHCMSLNDCSHFTRLFVTCQFYLRRKRLRFRPAYHSMRIPSARLILVASHNFVSKHMSILRNGHVAGLNKGVYRAIGWHGLRTVRLENPFRITLSNCWSLNMGPLMRGPRGGYTISERGGEGM